MNIGFKTPIQQNEPSMETPKEIPSMLKIPKKYQVWNLLN